jgi:creatinine amidohydrolase
MFLEKMKWPEVDALDRERVLVVCCISALEQHSLHLPMGTDYLIGTELVRRLEGRIADRLLCLPSVWLGCSSHHMGFAGTITASTRTMQKNLHDIASSARLHGFRRILFLNSHGGNRAVLGCSIQDLGEKFPELTIVGATYWDIAKEKLEKLRVTGFGGMGHACELETSIVLAVDSTLVDRSKAHPDGMMEKSRFTRGEMLSSPAVAIFRSTRRTSVNGGFGDPSTANADKGEEMLNAIVGSLEELCLDMLAGKI